MSIEAMKQALEALERSVATCFDQYAHQRVMSQPDHFINQAITSLRQAIAELESQDGTCQHCAGKGCVACDARETTMIEPTKTTAYWCERFVEVKNPHKENEVVRFYFDPPQRTWVGLTDEEVLSEAKRFALGLSFPFNGITTPEMFARAIEAKLKEKNG